jgi:hypothetical protein
MSCGKTQASDDGTFFLHHHTSMRVDPFSRHSIECQTVTSVAIFLQMMHAYPPVGSTGLRATYDSHRPVVVVVAVVIEGIVVDIDAVDQSVPAVCRAAERVVAVMGLVGRYDKQVAVASGGKAEGRNVRCSFFFFI